MRRQTLRALEPGNHKEPQGGESAHGLQVSSQLCGKEETLRTACVPPWLQTYSKTSNNKTTWTQMVTFYYRKSIPNIGFYKHWWVNKYNFKHKYKVKRQNLPAFCFLEKCHVLLQRWSHQSTNVTPSPVEASGSLFQLCPVEQFQNDGKKWHE